MFGNKKGYWLCCHERDDITQTRKWNGTVTVTVKVKTREIKSSCYHPWIKNNPAASPDIWMENSGRLKMLFGTRFQSVICFSAAGRFHCEELAVTTSPRHLMEAEHIL